MNSKTQEPSAVSPRFAGAIFFAAFSLLFLLFTKYTLLSLRDSALIPLFPSLLATLAIGALAGGLFGKMLAKKNGWLWPFFLGILIACLALILLSLIIYIHYYFTDPSLFSRFQHWQDYLIFYGVILASLFLTIGLWLLPLTGLVAIYFNKKFWPGLMAIVKTS
ncbi:MULTISPECIES: hypothetical protein [unclassified Legionella]|uniref:hypothetical protein n=1 Tax=unclassified Legionella TaxID=2622702 RepID=UPI001056A49E|nr:MULTISPECIES: hypothetical protein [unclassified Legionella]MDI9818107.1 hypothetical protein [Legionella sp. PL877]